MKEISILLVEDSRALRSLVSSYLTKLGCNVADVATLAEARRRLAGAQQPDLVLLDLDLADGDGLELLAEVDARGIHAIVVSERARTEDRIRSFESGAQDFIPKPVDLRELHLRIARLWRGQKGAVDTPVVLETLCGAAILDIANRKLKGANGPAIPLTGSEFRLLHLLVQNEGSLVERSVIARDVLGHGQASLSRSVDVMISKLRRKLAQANSQRFIRNVRSEGYVLITEQRGPEPHTSDLKPDTIQQSA